MKYEKNGKEGEGEERVAMLSGVGDLGSADSVEEGDDNDNDNDNEVDEYGNNKYEKGTYESYGHSDDDSDDNHVRGIVNEDDDEDEGGSESEEDIRKYKNVKITKNVKTVKKKDLKRRRKEESDDDENNDSDNEDNNMSTADLQRQEALALKMLRTA